jgi:hypothetical protein
VPEEFIFSPGKWQWPAALLYELDLGAGVPVDVPAGLADKKMMRLATKVFPWVWNNTRTNRPLARALGSTALPCLAN